MNTQVLAADAEDAVIASAMKRLSVEALRRLCKEPLEEVLCLHLRGLKVERVEALASCPNLTALDVSHNALTTLDNACFSRCRELWIIDASHNRIVSSVFDESYPTIRWMLISACCSAFVGGSEKCVISASSAGSVWTCSPSLHVEVGHRSILCGKPEPRKADIRNPLALLTLLATQESIEGLSWPLAIGYLDLSHNDLPLKTLRPLERSSVLELYLGDGIDINRRRVLRLVPGAWVLNGEFVEERERFLAEALDSSDERARERKSSPRHEGQTPLLGEFGLDVEEHGDGEMGVRQGLRRDKQQNFSIGHPEYRDMRQQGRLAREFLENVLWKVPSRYVCTRVSSAVTLLHARARADT